MIRHIHEDDIRDLNHLFQNPKERLDHIMQSPEHSDLNPFKRTLENIKPLVGKRKNLQIYTTDVYRAQYTTELVKLALNYDKDVIIKPELYGKIPLDLTLEIKESPAIPIIVAHLPTVERIIELNNGESAQISTELKLLRKLS